MEHRQDVEENRERRSEEAFVDWVSVYVSGVHGFKARH